MQKAFSHTLLKNIKNNIFKSINNNKLYYYCKINHLKDISVSISRLLPAD